MNVRSSPTIKIGIILLIYILGVRCNTIHNSSKTIQKSCISTDDAIAIAEWFVINNHYTDTPSSCSRIVLEDFEESDDIDKVFKARVGSLDEKAIGARFSGGRWLVFFRRKDNEDMCRCVTMDSSGLSIKMEPWDLSLSSLKQKIGIMDESKQLLVIAKLIDKQSCPHSGTFHFGVVMKYRVINIVEGKYPYDVILIAHGAPEIPREDYSDNSGTLKEFIVEDVHQLKLKKVEDQSDYPFSVIDHYEDIFLPRYLCITVDLVE